jgi:hypothetical protein
MSLVVVGVPIVLQLLVVPLSGYAADQILPRAPQAPTVQAAQALLDSHALAHH